MRSYSVDGEALEATLETFAALEIEETRGIALHLPHSPETRVDDARVAAADGTAHRFVRHVRTCGSNERPAAFALLERQRDAVEAAGQGTLVVGFEYLVGPVMDLVEIWRLPASAVQWLCDTGLIDSRKMWVDCRYKSAGGAAGRLARKSAVDSAPLARFLTLRRGRPLRW